MNLQNAIEEIDLYYGKPMQVMSDCLRGFVTAAPGKKLICVDFSSIEARVLAWLAGQENVLDVFRTHGKIYEHAISEISGTPIDEVTPEQRQIGKVIILALGYGGGVRAFQSMAKNYKVKIPDAQAKIIKNDWREKHKDIVSYWHRLEDAAIGACFSPGQKFSAGAKGREIVFLKHGSFLWAKLPGGGVLCYPYPKIKEVDTPWGQPKDALTFMGVDSLTKKWCEQQTYGGSLAENTTQAVARDLLVAAMHRWEENGYPPIMHCHDEAVSEVLKTFGSLKEAVELFCQLPDWAKGLPIAAAGWEGKRYRK